MREGVNALRDPDDVFWMLQRMAPMLAARHDGIVEDRHEPVLFALRDLRKDLDLTVVARPYRQAEPTIEADRRQAVPVVR